MNSTTKLILSTAIFAVLFGLAAVSISLLPYSLVWAINVLCGTNTPYDFESWCAAFFVLVIAKVTIFKRE